jgi:hypothetical protein
MEFIIFQKDILNIVISFLDKKNSYQFMRCNKFSLNFVGHSNVWRTYLSFKQKKNVSFQQLCELIIRTDLIPTNMKIQTYYGESYYIFRYFHLIRYEFDGYLNLYKLLQTSEKDLKEFFTIIDDKAVELLTINTGYSCFLKNLPLIKNTVKTFDDLIIKKIIIDIKNFRLLNIIINVENDKYETKYCSNIGFQQNHERYLWNGEIYIKHQFLLPDIEPGIFDRINKYGDGCSTRSIINLDKPSNQIKITEYFKQITTRIQVDQDELIRLISSLLQLVYDKNYYLNGHLDEM